MRVLDGRRRAPINGQDYHHPGRSLWPQRFSEKQEHDCNDAYQQKRRAGIHDDLAKPHTTLFDHEYPPHRGKMAGTHSTDDEGTG
ncbi:hypothetical protein NKJ26_31420 [Mesorhizobium sp. M0152]|uniref:hypothetical protein n=1 Tax=Mesorhizobium sp. M0152 TaxID=2956898 RepID=UPI0033372768